LVHFSVLVSVELHSVDRVEEDRHACCESEPVSAFISLGHLFPSGAVYRFCTVDTESNLDAQYPLDDQVCTQEHILEYRSLPIGHRDGAKNSFEKADGRFLNASCQK
jgi:hypothetical protein